MILPLTHHHSASSSEQQQHTGNIFSSILLNSEDILNENSKQEMNRLRRYCEQKVYLSYCDDPNQYLLHMLHKSENQTKDFVTELIMNRQSKVTTAIRNEKYQVRYNKDNSDQIKKIQEELTDKLTSMKKNIDHLSTPSVPHKQKNKAKNNSQLGSESEELYNGYMEFRKKGYWNQKSEQSKKATKFIRKMQKKRKQVEMAHQKNLTELEKHILERQKSEKKLEELEKKKIHDESSHRRDKAIAEKQAKKAQQKKKLDQAESFLKKYKTDKPFYIANEEKYKKQIVEPTQAEIKRKLAQIHKSKRPIDSEQLELHGQRYEQFKTKLLQAQEKKGQDQQIYQRNMEKLKELFHGRFHERIEEEENSYKNMVQEKKKQREKIMAYGASVLEEHKPTIDQKKREEVEKTIKLLQLKSEKGKKRILNGDSVILEDIEPDQHKKIGISYLEYLRSYNEGKKRKNPEDKSVSMLDLTKKKIVYANYLQEMRTKSRAETARTNSMNESHHKQKPWMKIISAQRGFSNRDKYNSVMDHVTLLESQAKQKQLQLKYTKNGAKALELKQKLDKYYLESVEAKMHVLKDVILKQ